MATIGAILKAWSGWALSFVLMAIGKATAQEWAVYMSIVAATLTAAFTVYKWVMDIIDRRKSKKS